MVAFLRFRSSVRLPQSTPGLAYAVLGPVRVWRAGAEPDLGHRSSG